MDRIDENNIPEDKELIDLILEKINEIVDWINSQ
tara:strand:- start:3319 stop:3420 length:102 start_codon:yes stop_codon:yes gene_type:complete